MPYYLFAEQEFIFSKTQTFSLKGVSEKMEA
jgi:hypothetical protein